MDAEINGKPAQLFFDFQRISPRGITHGRGVLRTREYEDYENHTERMGEPIVRRSHCCKGDFGPVSSKAAPEASLRRARRG
jgi:hypothetical protein